MENPKAKLLKLVDSIKSKMAIIDSKMERVSYSTAAKMNEKITMVSNAIYNLNTQSASSLERQSAVSVNMASLDNFSFGMPGSNRISPCEAIEDYDTAYFDRRSPLIMQSPLLMPEDDRRDAVSISPTFTIASCDDADDDVRDRVKREQIVDDLFRSWHSPGVDEKLEGQVEEVKKLRENMSREELMNDMVKFGLELHDRHEKIKRHKENSAIDTTHAYVMYSEEEKEQMLYYIDHFGPQIVSKHLNVPFVKLKRYMDTGAKRQSGGGRKVESPLLEKLMQNWIMEYKRNSGIIPPPHCCCQKAKQVARELGLISFKGSQGWFINFKNRNQLLFSST